MLDHIRDWKLLDQIAFLAPTKRYLQFYIKVGEARLAGHSWKAICNAVNSSTDSKDAKNLYRTYKSYCYNNKLKLVRKSDDKLL